MLLIAEKFRSKNDQKCYLHLGFKPVPSRCAKMSLKLYHCATEAELKSHVILINSSALIGGKFICKTKYFTRLALQSECCNFNQ